ncbi:Gut specific cysteine proteinase [Trichuris trichiura]|uniref:Gut specific cysteine proteinase n=1 Tax=Trichuris trichiura TaxID=36087 RepID=A0A077Z5F2_TRITR|nr:Gut specific cysteine proteinase [Trichuris trichiura]
MLRFAATAFALLFSLATAAYYEDRYEELKQVINKQMAENADHQMTWQFGKNSYFEGMSKKEIALRTKGVKIKWDSEHESRMKLASNLTLQSKKVSPANFDARVKWPKCKYIGLVKDQSNCGSCWAVSSASVMSDRICIAYGSKKVPFISDEDIMSCCGDCGDGLPDSQIVQSVMYAFFCSCNGGYPALAFKYWESKGVPTGGLYGSKTGCKPYSIRPCESCEYTAKTPECTKECISGYSKNLQKDRQYGKQPFCLASVEAIQNQLKNHGPIVVALRVYDDFIYYKSGIYQRTRSSRFLGLHAVKLIGWGESGVMPYWLAVNSWNTTFGEKGLFRIVRGYDECGIESMMPCAAYAY